MIKYSKVEGYKTLGEVGVFTHIYQWVEDVNENPIVIIINAYEGKPKVFKGYIYNKTKQYKSIPVKDNELLDIESYVDKIEQMDFRDFIKDTILDNELYNSFEPVV